MRIKKANVKRQKEEGKGDTREFLCSLLRKEAEQLWFAAQEQGIRVLAIAPSHKRAVRDKREPTTAASMRQ